MKSICVVTNCFNEKGNIVELHRRFKKAFESLPYKYKLLIIDNASTDGTIEEIEQLCREDKDVLAILNSRNFGHVRSPYHAFLQAEADALFTIVSDLQVDPEIILDFIPKWESGADAVIGVRKNNTDNAIMSFTRNFYYKLINQLAEIPIRQNFIGIGLYDKKFVNAVKEVHDPYPYFRGLVFEIGMKREEVLYTQKGRNRGITKNNFITLYDLAMLGICSNSKIPLRLMTMAGFISAFCSMMIALMYLAYKILYWDSFRMGIAPLVIGLFFIGSLQMVFMGILGEYVGFIYTRVQNRPHVTEYKRINF